MSRNYSRRDFLARAALLAVVVRPQRGLDLAAAARAAVTLRLATLDAGDSLRDGALLGVEEAKHAATLFGGAVSITHLETNAVPPTDLAAVIAGGSGRRMSSLIGAGGPGPVIVNAASGDDALRGASCSARLFHVTPSDAMRRDASPTDDVVAWDPALERFGADTLNQRFRSRFGRMMDEDAWCGWMAVKVLWESALRVRSAAPDRLSEFLSRDTTQFDGHKGRPLSFRRWDHQLRQPLYVRRGESLVEMPAAAGEESSRDLLDRLGTRASQSSCKL